MDDHFFPDSGWERSIGLSGEDPKIARPGLSLSSIEVGSMQDVLDDLVEEIALLNEHGNIVLVNRSWRETVEKHENTERSLGKNYRTFCAERAKAGYQPAVEAVAALDEILAGKRDFWQLIYNGGERCKGRNYRLSFHRIQVGDGAMINVTRHDRTEIVELRRAQENLSRSAAESQTLERQRLGRELHDSTSQMLTGIGLLLAWLGEKSPTPETKGVVQEMQGLLKGVHEEIRLISLLAHPPSLERLGLFDALAALVKGLDHRTTLEAGFEIVGEARALSPATQAVFYRVAQEALSNAYRHSRAKQVRVTLVFRRKAAFLLIADNGLGIPSDMLTERSAGVGLPSMRSRLVEIGGRLIIRNLTPGTAIIACALDPAKVEDR